MKYREFIQNTKIKLNVKTFFINAVAIEKYSKKNFNLNLVADKIKCY